MNPRRHNTTLVYNNGRCLIPIGKTDLIDLESLTRAIDEADESGFYHCATVRPIQAHVITDV